MSASPDRATAVVHFIVDLGVGGAERTLISLLKSTERPGVCTNVVISLRSAGPLRSEIEAIGVPVLPLLSRRGFGCAVRMMVTQNALAQGWMIHGNLVASLFSLVNRTRPLWTLHSTSCSPPYASTATQRLTYMSWRIERLVSPRIVSCSNAAKAFHTDRVKYRASHIRVIPAHFDTERFVFRSNDRTGRRSDLGVGDAVLFGSIGRFSEQKDFRNVIRAFAAAQPQIDPSCLVLIGKELDESNDDLTKWIADEGLQIGKDVLLLGEDPNIESWYSAIDVFVLGSQAAESFPMVLGEALSTGCYSISTDVGDAALMIGNAGAVVPPRDHESLARAMVVAGNAVRPLADRRWPASRAHVQAVFNSDALTKEWDSLYAEMLGQRGGAVRSALQRGISATRLLVRKLVP